ncbi:MAG: YfiR family protein [Pseudomonadota bacterium]
MALLRQFAWLACLLLWAGAAQADGSIERQVKAAYLYKFAGFVEWPEGSFAHPDSVLWIGVAGNDALAEQLEQTVAGRSVAGHPLGVRRLRRGEAPAGLHMLYVGALERGAATELLAAARGMALLTITDLDAGHAQAGMINFLVADEKLRFEVLLRQVNAAGLRISARMLAAAHKVVPS